MDPKKPVLIGGLVFVTLFYVALLSGGIYVAYLIVKALQKYIGG